MKNTKQYLGLLLATLLFAGCDEEPVVEIDSLSAMGNEFFYREKVKVWMAVKTDRLPAARFTWSADGGTLTQPQTLDENTWRAPREVGTYTITCTVEVDGVKKSRSRQMYVSGFYFDKLERTPHTFTGSQSSLNLVLDPVTNTSHLEARVNSTTQTRGFVQRAFDDLELKVPFSTQAQVGWISNFPTNQITIGTSTAQNTLYYEWTLNRDPDRVDNLYVDNIRFEWYPRGKSSGLPVVGGQPWNGNLRIQVRNVATNGTTLLNAYVNSPDLNFAQNQFKKVSLTIDADYIAHVFVESVEVINSNLIQTWRAANGATDDIYVNQWRINYVSNTGQTPLIFVDNAMGQNDGTILQ